VTPELRQVMEEHGDADKRIWATEYGAPTGKGDRAVSAEEQAQFLADAHELWSSWDWAGPLLVYAWRDRGDDPSDLEDNFGLLTRDRQVKPAFHVLRRLLNPS